MTIVGNLLLAIAALIFFVLLSTIYFTEPPKSGDAVVGYSWGIIYSSIAYCTCLLISSIIITRQGGFDWVSPVKTTRLFIVLSALLATCFTMAVASLFKNEQGPLPPLMRFYSWFVPILIPLVLLITSVILLNDSLRAAVPLPIYKWPLVFISAISAIGVFSMLTGVITENIKNETVRTQEKIRFEDENQKRIFEEIDRCDVMKNMVLILVFTDSNQVLEIRNKAVTKIKTNPKWQQELIQILESDRAAQAFTYLASNDADDPVLFIEPIRKGILKQASFIRESIRQSSHPSHFYPELFYGEIVRILQTVERFRRPEVNYTSELKELRTALNEPSEYRKVNFKCSSLLDKWLQENQ